MEKAVIDSVGDMVSRYSTNAAQVHATGVAAEEEYVIKKNIDSCSVIAAVLRDINCGLGTTATPPIHPKGTTTQTDGGCDKIAEDQGHNNPADENACIVSDGGEDSTPQVDSEHIDIESEEDGGIPPSNAELGNVEDNEEAVRKRKRIKLVPIALRKDFYLGKKTAPSSRDECLSFYGANPKANYVAKFASLYQKLQSFL